MPLIRRTRLFAIVVFAAGCSAGGTSTRPGAAARPGAATPLPPDVDPGKAFQPLSKIEPPVAPPQRPAGLTPLSERGAKQIASAKRLIDEQRYTEASLELERALRFDPNHYEIHRALAGLHWQAGNIERARTHASKTVEANPDIAAAHYILGRCHAIASDKAAALLSFRTAVLCGDLNEDQETAAMCHYHLAQVLAAEGFLEAALGEFAAYEKSAALVGSSTPRLELAALLRSTRGSAGQERSQLLEKLGRYGEAADTLVPLMAGAPPDVERGKRYARLLAQAGRFDAALTAAQSVPADDSDFVAFLFDLHQRAGHPERIVDDLRARVVAKPDDPALSMHLADALERLRRTAEARAVLAEFLERHADAHAVRLRLLDLAAASGDASLALRLAGEGLRKDPERAAEWESKVAGLAADARSVEAVIAASPRQIDDFSAAYLRGVIAGAAGNLELADQYFARALELESSFMPARVALAESHLRAYRYEEALKIASRRDADRPEDARLERVLGRVHEQLDDVEKAAFHFRAATQLDRGDVESMYALAQVYRRTDKGLQAQQQLRHLLERDPGHEGARELLALLYLKENKVDVAVQEIEELRRRSSSPTTVARCRTFLDPELRRDAAARRQVLMEAIEGSPPDAATWIAIAETYENDQASAMKEAYLSALAAEPRNEEAALGAVRATQTTLDFEEAARRLEELLSVRPNRHEWHLWFIDLLLMAQDFDKALSAARAAEARSDLPPAKRRVYRSAIVQTLVEAHRIDEAVVQLKTWAEAEPDHLDWRNRLAEVLARNKRAPEAVPVYEELVRADSKDAELRREFLDALIQADRHDRATQFVLDWLQDDPENDQLIEVLAEILAIQKRLDDAMELAQTRLLRTTHRERLQDLLVRRLTLAKRYAEAIELTETLIDEVTTILRNMPEGGRRRPVEQPREDRVAYRPNEPITLEGLQGRLFDLRVGRPGLPGLAGQLVADKQFRDAEQKITSWLDSAIEPRTRAGYLMELVDLQRAQGNEAQAGVTLERVLVLMPTHPTLNNDVAYLWIDRGERLDEAQKLIRYALSRAPRQAAYLDTYGWLLYKRGDFEGAKKWLLRAYHSRDADPVIHDHLGDTLWRLNQRDTAVQHWTLAMERTKEREEDARISDDERRVRTTTPQKIEDGKAGRKPPLAPLGGEPHPPTPRAGTQ